MKGICLIALVAASCSEGRMEYREGSMDAKRDVAKNELALATFDGASNAPWDMEYTRLLEAKYGIGFVFYSLSADPHLAEERARGVSVNHRFAGDIGETR